MSEELNVPNAIDANANQNAAQVQAPADIGTAGQGEAQVANESLGQTDGGQSVDTNQQAAEAAKQAAQQHAQQRAQSMLQVEAAEGGRIVLTSPWPDVTTIMEGMIDNKLVKKSADDIITITLANGRAEYQIVADNHGELAVSLLPGSIYTAEPAPEQDAEAPIRTVDHNGRQIA